MQPAAQGETGGESTLRPREHALVHGDEDLAGILRVVGEGGRAFGDPDPQL
jgi:hypothetical protein